MSLELDFQSFNYRTTKYDSENALALAKAAQLAYNYADENKVKQTVESWGFREFFKLWNVNGTQSYVAASEEAIIAVFAGTNEWADWASNLSFFPLMGPIGSVHRGFVLALDQVWSEMYEAIYDCKKKSISDRLPPQTLWITGHSLGAALATLATAKLRMEEDLPVHGLYNFGSPRVGDRIFARNFNLDFQHAYRFVNNTDIVTRVPARLMLYSHVGNFLYLDVEKRLHTDIHWWYQFLDTIEASVEDIVTTNVGGIADHSMDEYIKGLEQNRSINPYNPA
jgi:triacylglycerol lipase